MFLFLLLTLSGQSQTQATLKRHQTNFRPVENLTRHRTAVLTWNLQTSFRILSIFSIFTHAQNTTSREIQYGVSQLSYHASMQSRPCCTKTQMVMVFTPLDFSHFKCLNGQAFKFSYGQRVSVRMKHLNARICLSSAFYRNFC